MNGEQTGQRDQKSILIIILAVVVTVLLGSIIGYIVSGGLSDDPGTDLAADTTTTTSVATITTSIPTTTVPTEPSTTQVPGQLTIPAIEDTFTDALEPGDANGLDSVLEIEDDAPELKRALVRFEVAGLPEGETISEVVLQFSTISSGSQVAVHLVDGDWNESETNAANAPLLGERVGILQPGAGQGTLVEVDVTSVVTGPGSFSFYLTTLGDDTTEYASREAGAGGPVLIVRWGS